jgi:hypothetical protein
VSENCVHETARGDGNEKIEIDDSSQETPKNHIKVHERENFGLLVLGGALSKLVGTSENESGNHHLNAVKRRLRLLVIQTKRHINVRAQEHETYTRKEESQTS